MADFNKFLPSLLRLEGGWVDDPDDPGGATNKGITLLTFRIYSEHLLNISPTLENLKNLTDEQAGIIYQKIYWDRIDCNHIDNQDLADIFADFYVNAGGHAIKLMQQILNDKFSAGISVDGSIGPATCGAIQAAEQKNLPLLYKSYKAGRIQYYENLVKEHYHLKKFLRGWLNRVNSFPDM